MQNIILLHGALGSSKSFDCFLPMLSDSFKIFTFDFRGHGIYSHDDKINIDMLSDQLITFIEDNHIHGAIILGYSMGGYIALIASIKKPSIGCKIVTLATKFEWNESIAAQEIIQLRAIFNLPSAHPFKERLIELHGENNYTQCMHSTILIIDEIGAKRF